MSDSYQAIYDAVRSRISGGNVNDAVETALREAFGMAPHWMQVVAEEHSLSAAAQRRPSAVYRPSLTIDGDQWCALYGENLQDGCAGFGDTPDLAMRDFDSQWGSRAALAHLKRAVP